MAPCAKSGVGRTRTTTLIADLTMSAKQRLRNDACLGRWRASFFSPIAISVLASSFFSHQSSARCGEIGWGAAGGRWGAHEGTSL